MAVVRPMGTFASCAVLLSVGAQSQAETVVVIGDGEDLALRLVATGDTVLGPTRVRELLGQRAAESRPDATPARDLARDGRAAYAGAEFAISAERLDRAVDAYLSTGLADVPTAELALAALDLGIAELAAGRSPAATSSMALALRLQPDLVLDPVHGPQVRQALGRVRDWLQARRSSRRTIGSLPTGATIAIDGREPTGPAPVELDLAEGPHMVTARLAGFEQSAVRIDVAPHSTDSILVELEPAPSAPRALDALEAAEGGRSAQVARLVREALDADVALAVERAPGGLRAHRIARNGVESLLTGANTDELAHAVAAAGGRSLPPPSLPRARAEPARIRVEPRVERQAQSSGGWGTWALAGGAALAIGAVAVALVLASGSTEPSGRRIQPYE